MADSETRERILPKQEISQFFLNAKFKDVFAEDQFFLNNS